MHYLCSENKGADQLHGNGAAYLHLCYSHIQKADFLMKRLKYLVIIQTDFCHQRALINPIRIFKSWTTVDDKFSLIIVTKHPF